MSNKIAIFAFDGEPMCFAHALLNSMEMHEKGYDVKLILEGKAVTMSRDMVGEGAPFAELFRKVIDAGILDCVCRACAAKMGVLKEAEALGVPLAGELSGHPSMHRYMEAGYSILKF